MTIDIINHKHNNNGHRDTIIQKGSIWQRELQNLKKKSRNQNQLLKRQKNSRLREQNSTKKR